MSFLIIPRDRPRGLLVPGADKDAADEALAAEIARAVRDEVARLRRAAEDEGRAAGVAAGNAAIAAKAAALDEAAQALGAACRQLAAPLAAIERDLADLVMEFAFEIARHMVGGEVAANPAGLQPLVTRLIQEAAAECQPRQSLVVRLNPADHAAIAPVLALEAAHLLADAAIAPGGALVEIIAPNGDPLDKTEWDATIEGRLGAMRLALALDGAQSEVLP
jgi:flagellar assembly protein FliH